MFSEIEREPIILKGPPSKELKKAFFAAAERNTYVFSPAEIVVLEVFAPSLLRSPMSFSVFCEEKENSKSVNLNIVVNPRTFLVNGEDYSDLMPSVFHHECEEAWMYAKTGFSLEPGNEKAEKLAHNHALREQYTFAAEEGKAERLLEFMENFLMSFEDCDERQMEVEQNRKAYEYAMERFSISRDTINV